MVGRSIGSISNKFIELNLMRKQKQESEIKNDCEYLHLKFGSIQNRSMVNIPIFIRNRFFAILFPF